MILRASTTILIVLWGAFLPTDEASGQALAADSLRWEAGITGGVTSFRQNRSPWTNGQIRVSREWGKGQVAVQGRTVRRFGWVNHEVGVNAYLETGHTGYWHVGGRLVPASRILPSVSFTGEYYRVIGNGWVISAGLRHRNYEEHPMWMVPISLARYVGAWYLRVRSLPSVLSNQWMAGAGVTVRYYLNADAYLETEGYVGRTVLTSGPGKVESVPTGSVSAGGRWYLNARFGFTAHGQYINQSRYSRGSISAGFLMRW